MNIEPALKLIADCLLATAHAHGYEVEASNLNETSGTCLIRKTQKPIAAKRVRKGKAMTLPHKRDCDSDYDLHSSIAATIAPGELRKMPTNVAIEFPPGWEGKVETKSSSAGNAIAVLGGVIDGSYTGEIIVNVINLSKTPLHIAVGQKIAQLKIRPCSPCFKFEEVNRKLKATERGDDGYGSTGKM